jgi:hypothetical protein
MNNFLRNKHSTVTAPASSGMQQQAQPFAPDARWMKRAVYLPLVIPIILFLVSLYSRPTMYFDSGSGFLVLRSMLQGAAFNTSIVPDPANIANDVATFESWWSPGQYLVPGAFVWLGSDYGLALALTALISTIIGLIPTCITHDIAAHCLVVMDAMRSGVAMRSLHAWQHAVTTAS